MSSVRFGATIAVSAAVMLGLIALNSYGPGRIPASPPWVALAMGTVMAAVMLGLIWSMYESRPANFALSVAAAAVFLVAIWMTRGEGPPGDAPIAQATIPQHSAAILANERARFTDPRVSPIADGIIETQQREISVMKQSIADRKASPVPRDASILPPASTR